MPKSKKSDKDSPDKQAKPATKAAAKAAIKKAAPKAVAKPAKPAAKPKTPSRPVKEPISITNDDIALRAYFLAERRRNFGWPGDEHSDWVDAERQLREEAERKAKGRK